MATAIEYTQSASLPPLVVQLLDDDNTPTDLTGFTGSLKIGDDGTTLLTITSGVTCDNAGVTIAWQANALSTLEPGTYVAQVTASAGGLSYVRQFALTIKRALA
jgi:hypothetical protein